MENQTNNTDFTELRSLLQEQAETLPPCDLEDGFLHDLHVKLRSENMKRSSISLFWERLNTQIENIMNPTAVWGSAAFATVALAVALSFYTNTSGVSEFNTADNGQSVDSKLQNVMADNKIDFEGDVPAFHDESSDF